LDRGVFGKISGRMKPPTGSNGNPAGPIAARTTDGTSPPEPGNLRAKVLNGGVYLFVRQFLSLGLSLIGVFVITRLIGPEHYGAYVAASGIYLYLQNLGQVGVDVYLVRQSGNVAEKEYHVASTLLLLAALLEIAVVEGGVNLLSDWVQVTGFEPLLRILIFALPFQLLAIAASARLERLLDYRRVAAIELFGQVSYYILAVPLAVMGYGGWSLVAGWLFQQASMCAMFHWSAGYLPRLRLDRVIVPKMLSYTFGFSLVTWSWQLRALVNPLIVGHFLGATAVGQIGMAIRIVEALTFVKAIAWRLSVATLSRIQDDKRKLREAMTQGMQLQMLALAPVLLGFSWLGGLFLPQLLGARWAPILDVFPFIAASYLTNALFNMHSSALAVFRKNYETTFFHTVHILLFMTGAAICVPSLGLVGYGWGEMLALAGYLVLHRLTSRVVDAIDYRVVAVWWIGVTLGLFWHQLGLWAMAMPFISLLWPDSVRRLLDLYHAIRPKTGPAPQSRPAS
jgi:O-antigen/teichoic acid export membrane protein